MQTEKVIAIAMVVKTLLCTSLKAFYVYSYLYSIVLVS